VADGVGELREPAVEGPLSDVAGKEETKGEVGRLAGLQRGRYCLWMLRLWMEDQLDVLAGFLLERGDGLLNGLLLLRVVALIPPYDEVGGLRARRRRGERRR
jgi:hypothetical protein